MKTKLIITPGDSMWWLIRPEFCAFVDNVVMCSKEFNNLEARKNESGYHKVVWKRLSVLADNDLVELKEINIDYKRTKKDAKNVLEEILTNEQTKKTFIKDLIFAYKYWIEFNKQKLQLLPMEQKYYDTIKKNIPTWETDLKLLLENPLDAFNIKTEIVEQSSISLLERVSDLRELNLKYPECPLATLKEYEPFIKYFDHSFDAPFLTEKTTFTYKNKTPNTSDGNVHLPIQPEYDFMKFKLSKLKFQERIFTLINNYKVARRKLNDLLNRSEEITYGLYEGKLKEPVTKDFMSINNELLEIHRATRRRSKYLSNCFFGLSLIPIPALNLLFLVLSQGSKQISEFIESNNLYNLGLTEKGLATYYSFLESLMDISKLDKFPDVITYDEDEQISKRPFWRMEEEE